MQKKSQKEWLIRLIYCEMLGHDVSFGYISAINATQMGTSLDKRVGSSQTLVHLLWLTSSCLGFISCSLFLHEGHELMILVINSIQKLIEKPENVPDVNSALSAIIKLLGKDYIPALIQKIVELLNHPRLAFISESVKERKTTKITSPRDHQFNNCFFPAPGS